MSFLALYIFAKLFWRARKMLVKQPPGHQDPQCCSWQADIHIHYVEHEDAQYFQNKNDKKITYTHFKGGSHVRFNMMSISLYYLGCGHFAWLFLFYFRVKEFGKDMIQICHIYQSCPSSFVRCIVAASVNVYIFQCFGLIKCHIVNWFRVIFSSDISTWFGGCGKWSFCLENDFKPIQWIS